MSDVKLLPCPSCGGDPKLFVGLSEFTDGEIHCDCGFMSGNHPSASEAVARWNARTNTEITVAVNNALDRAAKVADDNTPTPAGGPFSHTNTARVTATDISRGIRKLKSEFDPISYALQRPEVQALIDALKPFNEALELTNDDYGIDVSVNYETANMICQPYIRMKHFIAVREALKGVESIE